MFMRYKFSLNSSVQKNTFSVCFISATEHTNTPSVQSGARKVSQQSRFLHFLPVTLESTDTLVPVWLLSASPWNQLHPPLPDCEDSSRPLDVLKPTVPRHVGDTFHVLCCRSWQKTL